MKNFACSTCTAKYEVVLWTCCKTMCKINMMTQLTRFKTNGNFVTQLTAEKMDESSNWFVCAAAVLTLAYKHTSSTTQDLLLLWMIIGVSTVYILLILRYSAVLLCCESCDFGFLLWSQQIQIPCWAMCTCEIPTVWFLTIIRVIRKCTICHHCDVCLLDLSKLMRKFCDMWCDLVFWSCSGWKIDAGLFSQLSLVNWCILTCDIYENRSQESRTSNSGAYIYWEMHRSMWWAVFTYVVRCTYVCSSFITIPSFIIRACSSIEHIHQSSIHQACSRFIIPTCYWCMGACIVSYRVGHPDIHRCGHQESNHCHMVMLYGTMYWGLLPLCDVEQDKAKL